MQPTTYALWCWIAGSTISLGVATIVVILTAVFTKLGMVQRSRAVMIAMVVSLLMGSVLFWITRDARNPLSPIPIWSWLRNDASH